METTNTKATPQENMDMHRKNLDALVQEFNGLDTDAVKPSEITELLTKIQKAVSGYNNNSWTKTKLDIASTEDPMRTAVMEFYYPVIKVVDVNIGDKEAPVMIKKVRDADKIISLKKLHDGTADGIGRNKRWYHLVEVFAALMAAKSTGDIEADDDNDRKRIAKNILTNFDFAAEQQDIDAVIEGGFSNTKVVKALQKVVDAMLGEGYAICNKDFNFVSQRSTKKSKNKKCTNEAINASEMAEVMLHVCYKLLTGGKYEILFPTK